jgi:hypothetical protein
MALLFLCYHLGLFVPGAPTALDVLFFWGTIGSRGVYNHLVLFANLNISLMEKLDESGVLAGLSFFGCEG